MAQNDLWEMILQLREALMKADWPGQKNQVEQMQALFCQKLGQPLDLNEMDAAEQKLETLLLRQKAVAEEFGARLSSVEALNQELGKASEKAKNLEQKLQKQRSFLLERPDSLRGILRELHDLSCGCGQGFRPQLPWKKEEQILENLTGYAKLLGEYAELGSALECYLKQMERWLEELVTLKLDECGIQGIELA